MITTVRRISRFTPSEYESFCLGILEGMCHGLPSVSFDVGGIPEVVTHGETGFLVPFGGAEALGPSDLRDRR